MIRSALVALGVAVSAIALSLLLVPGGEELALMYFKDRRFEQAESAYRLELSRRGMQRKLVVPLNELQIQAGHIDEAIGLLGRFSHEHPEDADVLELLADYHRLAQRPAEQVQSLERLTALAPTAGRWRELARWYDVLERPEDRRRMLRLLVAGEHADAHEYEALARLDAASAALPAAAATLERLWRKDRVSFEPATLMLYGALLADTGKEDALPELVNDWSERGGSPTVILELARVLDERNRPQLALGVVQALSPSMRESTEALMLSSNLQLRLGRGNLALQALLARDSEQRLPDALQIQLIDAALATGDEQIALQRAQALTGDQLPPWMLPVLIDAALRAQRPDAARRLFDSLDDATLAAQPLFAARSTLALGDLDAARRWAHIAAGAARDDTARTELALVYRTLGEDARARELLAMLSLDTLDSELRTEAINLYLALGEAQRGLQKLERSGDTQSPGWALLSTATGREEQVLEWLHGRAGMQADEQLVSDLYDVAEERGLDRLRLALAERALAAFATDEWRLRLAYALHAQQRAGEALPLVRTIQARLPEAEELYPQVLLATMSDAAVPDAPLVAELDSYVSARVARDGVSAPGSEQLVYDMLAAGALRSALPVLKPLARSDGERWFETYADTLDRLGERDRLVAALSDRLSGEDLEPEQRQWLLTRLARAGAPATALAELEQLALADHGADQYWLHAYEEAAKQSGQMPRLIAFLHGAAFEPGAPRHAHEARTWVLLAHLNPRQSLPVLARLVEHAPESWDSDYREALLRLGERDTLARHLLARSRGATPAARREIAFALLEMGRKNDAVALFQALASTAQPGAADVRQLLFLWGPRPGPAARDWLAARVQASSGPARAGWARHLIAVGDAPRAAALLAADAGRGDDGEHATLYLEALIASRDRTAVRAEVDRLLSRAQDLGSLRRIARLAAEHDHAAAARAAWSRIVERDPGDREALRAVGMSSYDLGQWRRAADLLARYLRSGPGDFEVHYFVAEALAALGDRERAAPHFEAAVGMINAHAQPDFRMRSVRAQSLHRLGHTQAAAGAYERLLAERPATGHLRADYGDLLLDSGGLERAGTVLR